MEKSAKNPSTKNLKRLCKSTLYAVTNLELTSSLCINHNLSKAVWQAGCNAALFAKDKSCSLSGYLSSQACR